MRDHDKTRLLALLNEEYGIEGCSFTMDELDMFINISAIGEMVTEFSHGADVAYRWDAFVKMKPSFNIEPVIETEMVKNTLALASDNLVNQFYYDEVESQWLPVGELSLEGGLDVLHDMLRVQAGADLIQEESSWIIGNIACILQEAFQDEYDPSMVASITDMSVQTVMMYTSVFKAFQGRRVYGASFTHHKEAMYMKGLDVPHGLMLLTYAKEHSLTVKQMKTLGRRLVKRLQAGEEINTITQELYETAMNSIMPSSKLEWFGLLHDNKPVHIKDNLSDRMMSRCKYICQLKPEVRVIKYDRDE